MRNYIKTAMETSNELYEQLLTIFTDLRFHRKYGLQLGICLLVTLLVICASVRYITKKKKKKKKREKTRRESSSSIETNEDDRWRGPEFAEDLNHHSIALNWEQVSENKMLQRSKEFYQFMNKRRTVRTFSKEKFPRKIIENLILTAGTSPSGANQQPWTYVVVDDHEIKAKIRQIVEAEEEINYKRRMGNQWVEALKHLNVNWIKPYITDAPYVLLVFKQSYAKDTADGNKIYHYYSELSTAIATGILYAAIHFRVTWVYLAPRTELALNVTDRWLFQNAGLVSLVSTPMNCDRALSQLLGRPAGEHLLFLMPVGYPTIDCTVPAIKRKNLDSIYVHH